MDIWVFETTSGYHVYTERKWRTKPNISAPFNNKPWKKKKAIHLIIYINLFIGQSYSGRVYQTEAQKLSGLFMIGY